MCVCVCVCVWGGGGGGGWGVRALLGYAKFTSKYECSNLYSFPVMMFFCDFFSKKFRKLFFLIKIGNSEACCWGLSEKNQEVKVLLINVTA